jgi:hypothetical protein
MSIMDRCNLRCMYCMPEPEYRWLPRHDLLTIEKLGGVADVYATLGSTRFGSLAENRCCDGTSWGSYACSPPTQPSAILL